MHWGSFVQQNEFDLRFRYLPDEYARGIRAHQFGRSTLIADAVVSLLFLIASVAILLTGPAEYRALGLILLGLSVLLPAIYAASVYAMRAAINADPRAGRDYWLQISDSGIRFRSEGVDSHLEWKVYQRVVKTRGFYLLYYGRRQFSVIPLRVLSGEQQIADFEALLRRHLEKFEFRG